MFLAIYLGNEYIDYQTHLTLAATNTKIFQFQKLKLFENYMVTDQLTIKLIC